jgi:hypothetical protein
METELETSTYAKQVTAHFFLIFLDDLAVNFDLSALVRGSAGWRWVSGTEKTVPEGDDRWM